MLTAHATPTHRIIIAQCEDCPRNQAFVFAWGRYVEKLAPWSYYREELAKLRWSCPGYPDQKESVDLCPECRYRNEGARSTVSRLYNFDDEDSSPIR